MKYFIAFLISNFVFAVNAPPSKDQIVTIMGKRPVAKYNATTKKVEYEDGIKPDDVVLSLLIENSEIGRQLSVCLGEKKN